MDNRKRKRDDDASDTIVTFHAPGDRRFDRLLRDSSLDEMKNAIRKKLKVTSDSTIHLAQLRDGARIDLEDEDDYDALFVSAAKQTVVDISVTVDKVGAGSPPRASHAPTSIQATTGASRAAGDALSSSDIPAAKDNTTASQTKRKSVNFDENSLVRTPTPASGSQKQHGINSPASILRRTTDTASSLDPQPSIPHTAPSDPHADRKKRKRASAVKPQVAPEPSVSATPSPEIDEPAKPKKRKKVVKSKAIVEDESIAAESIAEPSTPAASADNQSKEGSKASSASKDDPQSKKTPRSSKTSRTTGEPSNAAETESNTSSEIPKNTASDAVVATALPNGIKLTTTKRSFTTQLAESIQNSLASGSSTPEPEGVSKKAKTTGASKRAGSASTEKGKKGRPPKDFTEAELGAVKDAVETVRKRHQLASATPVAKSSEAPGTEPDAPPVTSAPATTGTSSKSAPPAAPPDAALTIHAPASQSSSRRNSNLGAEEPRVLPIIPGSAISEVTMEGKGEGSSSDSDTDDDDEEGPWGEEGVKQDAAALSKLLARAGVSSLDDVDMDALIQGPKPKGSVLAEIADSSSDSDDDDKLSAHEESEEENDRSFRKLEKSLAKKSGGRSSDEEDEDDGGELVPPTIMDTDAAQTQHQEDLGTRSSISSSSIEQDEVADVLAGRAGSVAPSVATNDADPATPGRRNSDTTSTHHVDAPAAAPVTQAHSPRERSGPVDEQEANGTHSSEDPDDPIQPAEDHPASHETRAKADLTESSATEKKRNATVASPSPAVTKRMKNRRGEIPTDGTEQPVLVSQQADPPVEKPRSQRGKAAQAKSAALPVAAEKPAKEVPPASAPNASEEPSSTVLMPPPTVPAAASKKRRPSNADTNKPDTPAVTPSIDKSTTPSTSASAEPKKRGRPKLSEEEKARRAAEKKAETERKAAEKKADTQRRAAERKQLAAETKAAAKEAKKDPKETKKANSKTPGALSSYTPSNSEPSPTSGTSTAPNGSQSKKQSTAMSNWTALSQESDAEPDMTMIDELQPSSPDISLTALPTVPDSPPRASEPQSKADAKALFLDAQSQRLPLPAPSSPKRIIDPPSDDEPESAPKTPGKQGWTANAKFSKLADVQSQDLFGSTSTPAPLSSPTPKVGSSSVARRVGVPSWGERFPKLSSLPKVTKEAPSSSQASASKPKRTPMRKLDESSDDDDDDESDSDEDEPESSHIPKGRRASVTKKKKSGLSSWD